jgi:uncharacterized protein (TIGR02646 family)
MIRLTRPPISNRTLQKLAEYQSQIDILPDYSTKIKFSKDDFAKKNNNRNTGFNEIKTQLKLMSSGAERCHYCEDSKADEVEHFYPKDVYPEWCYIWENYFYACGSCNLHKSNKCAIIDPISLNIIDNTPPKRIGNIPVHPQNPPNAGVYAMINPVNENPLDFFLLDLNQSFAFSEFPEKGTIEYLKAKYTLETLGLNGKEYLRKARRVAFGNFRARMKEYIHEKNAEKPDPHKLEKMKSGIQEESHQVVWQEMKRQHENPELINLFRDAPETLQW